MGPFAPPPTRSQSHISPILSQHRPPATSLSSIKTRISNATNRLKNATYRLKVKITKGPEPVPKKCESKLPPRDKGSDSSSDDSDTDDDWDEASIIDGHAWWEYDSEDEVRLALEAIVF